MDKLKQRILDQLAQNVGLISAHDLATALMEDVGDVRNVLTALVRQKKVVRHHSAPGELTYSMRTDGSVDDDGTVHTMPEGKLSLTDRIRSILAHARQPMTAKQVAEALPGETEEKVRSALYNAVHRREVVSTPVEKGQGSGKAYALADARVDTTAASATVTATATATASATALDNPQRKAEPTASAREGTPSNDDILGLLNENVFMAEFAVDSYMRAHLNMEIYDFLTRSRDAALKARAAFQARGLA